MESRNIIARSPAGMTLIELLVVISILGLLSVLVLPAVSGNRENTANQNAAQQMSGLISQSRNDAISAGRWSGLSVLPTELDIARCRVPPPYRGDLLDSTLQFTQSAFGSRNVTGSAAGILSLTPFAPNDRDSMNRAGVTSGDYITFDGQPLRYEIVPFHNNPNPSLPFVSENGFRISPVGSPLTTPWPPANVPMTFAIERQPRIVGSAIALSTESSIDMRWSGYGSGGSYITFWLGTVGTAPPQVSLLFDERGAVRQLIIDGTRNVVDGPVFFLIGRSDRRNGDPTAWNATDDTSGANWQYPTSYWVAIDPTSGQTRIAECAPTNSLVRVEESQRYVREGLITQGL